MIADTKLTFSSSRNDVFKGEFGGEIFITNGLNAEVVRCVRLQSHHCIVPQRRVHIVHIHICSCKVLLISISVSNCKARYSVSTVARMFIPCKHYCRLCNSKGSWTAWARRHICIIGRNIRVRIECCEAYIQA